ncbi:MAG: zinc-binding dehydrogenase [Elusimicrobia bacterium GWA2_69_24]|nr:MAG: zinc-binding dehydrogenase [Elusimicrobia bacterium GWA2_69_24]HBL17637.1 zinc-binding dehydrogenase [Elusimicrobiota bacterium]
MRRIVVASPGGHAALRLVEGPDPVPGPGQVRVRVRAAGVNYADCMVRMGLYSAAKGRYPITPGFEFAGEVDAAGEWGRRFAPGTRVLGVTRFGGYAEAVVVDERQLWPCPDGWDFAECAAFPAAALTAYYGLFRVARIEPGETLLIHSAAGGAGSAFVQLGRIAGCRTVGVVGSPHKVPFCRALGADAVLLRSAGDWLQAAREAAPGGYDAIFDSGGVATLRSGYHLLAPGGRLVAYGFADMLPRGGGRPGWLRLAWNWLRVPRFSPLDMTTRNRGVAGFNVVYLFGRTQLLEDAMSRLLGWVAEGKLGKPAVRSFPLERAAEAQRALESGDTVGKLVLAT